MLEHQKIVLQGVSDHQGLFRKELIKSLDRLNAEVQAQLKHWVRRNFYHRHARIIDELCHMEYEIAS
jgi:hypothetical protein